MKVILMGELRGKGGEGDIVDVAQGYAENYLFPNRMAQPATPGNIKQLEERRHNIAEREAKRIADANALKQTLDGKSVTVEARIGDDGQLFGSVTTSMIADAIKEQLNVEVDRKRIEHAAAIKTVGRHQVTINLYRDINAELTVLVGVDEKEPEEEAEASEADEGENAEAEKPAEEAAEAPAEQ
ncbi:MAG: 50S ribosomal protein L9 [Coriobacteriaceae bacterium]|nr:MAG: 50S ribosomal protein L9 [Coriobacteriaceae bacterium]